MLIGSFFGWWYGRGWKQAFTSLSRRIKGISELFSAKQLLKTLFQPWRRITTIPGASLEDKLQAWGDNLISRCVGFTVRSAVLLAAFVMLVIVGVLTIAEIIAWPFLPLAVPLLIVKGLV